MTSEKFEMGRWKDYYSSAESVSLERTKSHRSDNDVDVRVSPEDVFVDIEDSNHYAVAATIPMDVLVEAMRRVGFTITFPEKKK